MQNSDSILYFIQSRQQAPSAYNHNKRKTDTMLIYNKALATEESFQ